MEQQSSEVFSSLHGQLERLGAELAECRAERDSSAQEWAQERREEREKVNTQVSMILYCVDSCREFRIIVCS